MGIVHGAPEELDALVEHLRSTEEFEPAIRDYIVSFFELMLETLAQVRRDRRM